MLVLRVRACKYRAGGIPSWRPWTCGSHAVFNGRCAACPAGRPVCRYSSPQPPFLVMVWYVWCWRVDLLLWRLLLVPRRVISRGEEQEVNKTSCDKCHQVTVCATWSSVPRRRGWGWGGLGNKVSCLPQHCVLVFSRGRFPFAVLGSKPWSRRF